MANSAQARKRARQGEARRQRNASYRSMMRTYLKQALTAVEAGDKEAATAAYSKAAGMLDKSAGKGLIHKNKAARHKSRMNKAIQAMA